MSYANWVLSTGSIDKLNMFILENKLGIPCDNYYITIYSNKMIKERDPRLVKYTLPVTCTISRFDLRPMKNSKSMSLIGIIKSDCLLQNRIRIVNYTSNVKSKYKMKITLVDNFTGFFPTLREDVLLEVIGERYISYNT